MARFVGFYLPIKGSGSAGYLEGGVGRAGLRARLSSRSDWPVDPGGLGWIRPLGGDGGLIGRGRACWRGPRRGRTGPAVFGVTWPGPGCGTAGCSGRGLLRARALGTYPKSPELDGSTAEGHTMTLEPSSLSSGFVTQFSLSPSWPAGQSPSCAHRDCNRDPLFLRPGSVGGTGEGRGEGARPRGGRRHGT